MSEKQGKPQEMKRRIRSLLYVPAHRPEWFAKATRSGADAIILDLEDSVPADRKDAARRSAGDAIAQAQGVPVYVRINSAPRGALVDDLESVIVPGIAGVQIPKVDSQTDVYVVEALLECFEERQGIPIGHTAIVPLIESSQGLESATEIFAASSRIELAGAMLAEDGDLMGSLGFEWGSTEALSWLRMRLLVAARAAGVEQPICGVQSLIHDDELTREFAVWHKRLGYTGMAVLHPRQVAVANEVFGLDPDALHKARALVKRLEAAGEKGLAAIEFEGRMVDLAMARTALARIAGSEGRTP